MKVWMTLYNEAKNKLNAQEISPFIEFGNNSCAILGSNNKIYSGISITSNTGINCSAEKSAVTTMLNDGEKKITKIVLLNELEEIIVPSSKSLEYLLELCENPDGVEVLTNLEKESVVKLSSLLPDWWGTFRLKKN